jgi:hypothetical protein
MRHQLRIVGSLLACGLLIPAAAAAAAAGGIGVRLLPLTGASVSNPLARSYIVANLSPGDVITRRVEVTNTTAATRLVAVYAAAVSAPGGVFRFGPGHAQNDVSSWTRISTPLFRLDAGAVAGTTRWCGLRHPRRHRQAAASAGKPGRRPGLPDDRPVGRRSDRVSHLLAARRAPGGRIASGHSAGDQ